MKGVNKIHFSNKDSTWKRIERHTRWPVRLLFILALISLIAPFLATDEPWYVQYKGHHLLPAFSFKKSIMLTDSKGQMERLQYDIADWKRLPADRILFAPIPYTPGKSDFANADYSSPFGEQVFEDQQGRLIPIPARYRHYFGTGKTGDDILAAMIHGTRISFLVGILSMFLASIAGILLGALAGYFGDYSIKITRARLTGLLLSILPAFFYAFQTRHFLLVDAFERSGPEGILQFTISLLLFFILLIAAFKIAGKLLKGRWFHSFVFVPVDTIICKMIEVLISLPRLLLILTLAALTKPSFLNVVLIIAFTYWTEIARLTRAEMLRLREQDYITAARSMGFTNFRIIFKHALPNSMGSVIVSLAFGAASAILLESGLGFLGIGIPQDIITWGSLLASGKENINAWWITLFPGLAIFCMVLIYNFIGEGMRTAILPKEHALIR